MTFSSHTPEGKNVSHTFNFDFDPLIRAEESFKAGGVSQHLGAWSLLTTDVYILDIIQHGLKIDFAETPPDVFPVSHPVSQADHTAISSELQALLTNGVIRPCVREAGDFLSPIFARLKKDGARRRLILNLKKLNTFVQYKHFKMEHFHQVLEILKPGCGWSV